MTGKTAENAMEIRAYIKARSLLGLKPVKFTVRCVTFMERGTNVPKGLFAGE